MMVVNGQCRNESMEPDGTDPNKKGIEFQPAQGVQRCRKYFRTRIFPLEKLGQ